MRCCSSGCCCGSGCWCSCTVTRGTVRITADSGVGFGVGGVPAVAPFEVSRRGTGIGALGGGIRLRTDFAISSKPGEFTPSEDVMLAGGGSNAKISAIVRLCANAVSAILVV